MNALQRAIERDREARERLGIDETGTPKRGRPVEVDFEKEVRDAIAAYRKGLALRDRGPLERIESPLVTV